MEPLVIFGAGLVIYCGYLSIMDEIRAWKKSDARQRIPDRKTSVKTARHAAIPLFERGNKNGANRGYTVSNGLLAQHLR